MIVAIDCPDTGKPLHTGILASEDSFAGGTFRDNDVDCPHCGARHRWQKADARLLDEIP